MVTMAQSAANLPSPVPSSPFIAFGPFSCQLSIIFFKRFFPSRDRWVFCMALVWFFQASKRWKLVRDNGQQAALWHYSISWLICVIVYFYFLVIWYWQIRPYKGSTIPACPTHTIIHRGNIEVTEKKGIWVVCYWCVYYFRMFYIYRNWSVFVIDVCILLECSLYTGI